MANKQLTIHISRTSVHVAEVLRSSQEVVKSKSMQFEEMNALAYKAQLKRFFDEHMFDDNYEEYTLAWCTPKQALMPMLIFNDTKPADVLNLLFGDTVDTANSDFNRLAELNMVSVYEIPDWVKSFFVMKYPHIIYKHEHAMSLRALFQGATYKLKTVLTLADEYMNISIIKKNELQFSNSFEYQNAEDILYHLLFVLEQKKLKEEAGEIQFYFQNNITMEIASEVVKLLNNHALIKKHSILESDNSAKLQLLCV
ncbi:MAG: DUF3822 family protein [Brumimicrobium sp.]